MMHALEGLKAPEISARMDLCGATVRHWLKRFNVRGLRGLEEDVRAGRPPTYSAEQRSAVINTALTRPADLGLPFASWTLDRLVARLAEQGIAMRRSRISEIFIQEGLKWRHEETWFGERVDPDFARKRSHGGGRQPGLVGWGCHTPAWRRPMPTDHPATALQVAVRANDTKLFASLELSKSRWLVTVSAPGSEKLSRHTVSGGDGGALLELLGRLRTTAERRAGLAVRVVVIQEAGLDGFWIHRLLEANGIESHVVDPASIAVDRRHRRAKTDAIDGEMLVRTLMAWARGERRVCSMVRPPSPEEEDRRRLTRERGTLLKERTQHTNRIKGLLSGQGITDYDPLRKDRLARLDALTTGDGRPLPDRLKAAIRREIERVDVVVSQMARVERERDALVGMRSDVELETAAAVLARLKGIGTELGSLIWLEALFRGFDNRRQIAAYAGLAPSPWQSGGTDREQGISKSGNRRLRHATIELAWFWLRHQPGSALSVWFRARIGQGRGRIRRIAIVALARKLLVALWRYVAQGVVPPGATFKA